MKFLLGAIGILGIAIGLWLVFALLATGNSWIAVFAMICLIGSCFIFLHPKAYPYRYIFPGILTFLLFIAVPVLFSVIVAFSNYGTGHFQTPEESYKILLGQKDEFRYSYEILREQDNSLSMYVYTNISKYFGKIPSQGKVQLQSVSEKPTLEVITDRKVLVSQYRSLKDREIILPNNDIIYVSGLESLIGSLSVFESSSPQELRHKKNGKTYTINIKEGFFQSQDGENLYPGFRCMVGVKNFSDLVFNQELRGPFLRIFFWNIAWAFLSVFFCFALGISLALLVNNKKLHFKMFYRVLLIIPYSIPFFIAVLMFKGILNKEFGVVNLALQQVGISAIPWLGDPFWAKASCLLVNLWLGFPYMFIVTTGILQSIPNSIYESAILDGSSAWNTFRKITMPLILPAVAPLLLGSFAFNFNNFAAIYLLTAGGPSVDLNSLAGATDILVSYIYKISFVNEQRYGMACALAIVVFSMLAFVTLFQFKLSGLSGSSKTKEG